MMTDALIYKTADLMQEQVRDYAKLEAACQRLAETLIHGEASTIESMTRVGEVALLQMRARLVRIIQSLTAFANARSESTEKNPLNAEARAKFESASNDLLLAAREFQRTRARAAALTTSGATFATACIEVCGIQPTTYSGPYSRNGEARSWA